MTHFISFFCSHRNCNEAINPISVGIVPFRLFWLRPLKWNGKQNKPKKDSKINQILWIFHFASFFFVLTDMTVNSSTQFQLELFHSDCFDEDH